MLKINLDRAFKSYWYLFTSQMGVYGLPALALGVVCFVLSGFQSLEVLATPIFFVAAIVAGVSLFIFVVGTVSDLFFLVLKVVVWCIAFALSRVVNPVLRRSRKRAEIPNARISQKSDPASSRS